VLDGSTIGCDWIQSIVQEGEEKAWVQIENMLVFLRGFDVLQDDVKLDLKKAV
jgi:hypothetical protein